jgi:hypothetical protein
MTPVAGWKRSSALWWNSGRRPSSPLNNYAGRDTITDDEILTLRRGPMLIGIDFDNTIVRYDRLFHLLAMERGLIPPETPVNKTAIRDYLRQAGLEDDWTELQGIAYGPEIARAEPFAGALDFLTACRRRGVATCVISHKTKHPFRGEKHDLHAAARRFLVVHGFLGEETGLGDENVYLELTKEAKLARIASSGCTHFVDDLPELLAVPEFPAGVARYLFDPAEQHADDPLWTRFRTWLELDEMLLPADDSRFSAGAVKAVAVSPPSAQGTESKTSESPPMPPHEAVARLLAAHGWPSDGAQLEPITGGGNNRGYRLTAASGDHAFLKWYFRHPNDPRDRLGTEYAVTSFAHAHDVTDVPRPFSRDDAAGLALYEFVDGRRLKPGEVDDAAVDAAIGFYQRLNAYRDAPDAETLPIASEACFSVQDHVERIGSRVQALVEAAPAAAKKRTRAEKAMAEFVVRRLAPAWGEVYERIDRRYPIEVAGRSRPIPEENQRLSPSDFGFHNALRDEAGRIRFIDLEYAGWDGVSKSICDFFCQVQVPVPRSYWKRFVDGLSVDHEWPAEVARRAAALLPAYRVKWCCIVLNVFLPTASARRSFGTAKAATAEVKAAQLAKAAEVLDQLTDDFKL